MSCHTDLLIKWYDEHKRVMPWRDVTDPYATLVSETMLQQTQVATVIPYYLRFITCFPTVFNLANATDDALLKIWEGLGYYNRVINLKKAAQYIVENHQGIIPNDIHELLKINGIGAYTAGAILSIAYQLPYPAVDGNITRVLSRLYGIRSLSNEKKTKKQVLAYADSMVKHKRPGDVNQALMDLGATICISGTPICHACPLQSYCDANKTGDAANLPKKPAKAKPISVYINVSVITRDGYVLVAKRNESMLRGMYVFILEDQSRNENELLEYLTEMGISCQYEVLLGYAKHTFTHRKWHMTIHHFKALSAKCPPDTQWALIEDLSVLPFPSAMHAALIYAKQLL